MDLLTDKEKEALRSYPIEKLEKWQLGYIAGIIDGEGCISLSKHTNRETYVPAVKVAMTNEVCIHFLHNMTEIGNFNVDIRPKPYKPEYKWRVGSRLDIYILLRTIYPYLVVKKKQASVMLEFVERHIQGTSRGCDLALWEEMRKLNS